MNVLIVDGHPDRDRLLTHLLDHYRSSLPAEVTVTRINVRELVFSPNLERGYAAAGQSEEPDLQRVKAAMVACDHMVVAFPLWWGGEPAMLKGLMDRVLLPGFAFKYHRGDVWWDRLMTGRSADVIVTMDTPPWYLRLAFGDPVMRRWRRQILGFCGFGPVRAYRFGPTRRGAAKKRIRGWETELARAARGVLTLRRPKKTDPQREGKDFGEAIGDGMA